MNIRAHRRIAAGAHLPALGLSGGVMRAQHNTI